MRFLGISCVVRFLVNPEFMEPNERSRVLPDTHRGHCYDLHSYIAPSAILACWIGRTYRWQSDSYTSSTRVGRVRV